jgi:hypothetical protein
MKVNTKRPVLLLFAIAALAIQARGDDLKAYYEQQKAEFVPTFVAPELGAEVSIKLAAGQTRKGILMKLTASELSLLADTGSTVTYRRTALHESSRAQYFAEDHAHAKALEKMREYRQQLHNEDIAEQQANIHDGRISVTAKVDKDSDKDVDEDERDNEKTGNTTTTTTTTKTYTDIQNLKITIANNATHPDTYTLEWYFFGKAMEKTTSSGRGDKVDKKPLERKTALHDSGTKRITVDGRKRRMEEVSSKAFVVEKITVDRVSSNSSNSQDPRVTESGKENAGWLVLLKYGDAILDRKASSKSYLTEEWLDKL